MERKLSAVLSTLPYGPEIDRRLDEAFAPAKVFHVDGRDDEAIAAVIGEVEAAVLPGDLDDRILAGKRLKWIHCCHAGLTKSARPEVFERGILLTGGAGRSAPALAEHVFYFALALCYCSAEVAMLRGEQNWGEMKRTLAMSRGLAGRTMGIVGLGHTGMAVAERAKAFGMRVMAYTRSPRENLPASVDRVFCYDRGDTLDELLAESDFLVLCCHLCDETYHMIGPAEFAKMKPGAVLINIARGSVVDEAALCTALQQGILAGAGCDVFEEEPLPASSPLWTIPNLMMTPHVSPATGNFEENATRALFENVGRYLRGEKLLNQMQPRDMLTTMPQQKNA